MSRARAQINTLIIYNKDQERTKAKKLLTITKHAGNKDSRN